MTDVTIFSDGAALIGSGAWFADKLFGPSVESLGEQLKVYFSDRSKAIFGRSEAIARQSGIVPRAMPPGLLAKMVIDSSFSDPAEEITEWWANLFVDASQRGSNRHVVFSDIMATIGPVEADCLNTFFSSFSFSSNKHYFNEVKALSHSIDTLFASAADHWFGELPTTSDTVAQLRANMLRGEVPWPIRPVEWSYPLKSGHDGDVRRANMSNPWYSENLISIGILERAGLFEMLKATKDGFGFTSWAKAVSMTPLGLEFYRICTGGSDV